jgi:S1-C subfamily serine protease
VPPIPNVGPAKSSPKSEPPIPGREINFLDSDRKRKEVFPLKTKKLNISALLFVAGGAITIASLLVFYLRGQTDEAEVIAETVVAEVTTSVETTIDSPSPSTLPLGKADWDLLARSVVFIEALAPCDWRGSGTIVLDGSYVLTNEHVASSGECPLRVGLTTSLSATPSGSYEARVLVTDKTLDLAVLRLVDASGVPLKVDGHAAVAIDYDQPLLGSRLATLGYPALGSYEAGRTITFTSGTFSGMDYTDGEFYKTDAQMRGGVSGGAAFNESGLLIGIPTAGLIEEDTGDAVGINLIRPVKFAKPLLDRAQTDQVGSSAIDSGVGSGGSGSISPADPRFGTCKEAIANGYGPYYYEIDEEYNWYFDRDSDGIVCER